MLHFLQCVCIIRTDPIDSLRHIYKYMYVHTYRPTDRPTDSVPGSGTHIPPMIIYIKYPRVRVSVCGEHDGDDHDHERLIISPSPTKVTQSADGLGQRTPPPIQLYKVECRQAANTFSFWQRVIKHVAPFAQSIVNCARPNPLCQAAFQCAESFREISRI